MFSYYICCVKNANVLTQVDISSEYKRSKQYGIITRIPIPRKEKNANEP